MTWSPAQYAITFNVTGAGYGRISTSKMAAGEERTLCLGDVVPHRRMLATSSPPTTLVLRAKWIVTFVSRSQCRLSSRMRTLSKDWLMRQDLVQTLVWVEGGDRAGSVEQRSKTSYFQCGTWERHAVFTDASFGEGLHRAWRALPTR